MLQPVKSDLIWFENHGTFLFMCDSVMVLVVSIDFWNFALFPSSNRV